MVRFDTLAAVFLVGALIFGMAAMLWAGANTVTDEITGLDSWDNTNNSDVNRGMRVTAQYVPLIPFVIVGGLGMYALIASREGG